jgi:hypothetical protein
MRVDGRLRDLHGARRSPFLFDTWIDASGTTPSDWLDGTGGDLRG